MNTISKETRELDVLLGRGRKRLSDEAVEEVALTVIERAFHSQYSSTSARVASRDLSLPCLQYERIAVNNSCPWNILWSDEAHFSLDGAVNTPNCRIWGTTSPNVVHEQPLYPDYITAWCCFTADFILGHHGPQFHYGCRYCDLLHQQIIPALQERECLETTVFMQDDAPPHIARPVQASALEMIA
ncbi:hypothetical protein AVEN_126322-1 [Araneus ventricosus]|uniref:Tc1-like transposase DDE domain-containing protein n=1 Tax=Araneus ventricosus TaxID=182803 RepID=A0A4Y2FDK9_ARAVE|nr:hypothetical protein AVEN_126322-1 [Araneus ventricosus]